MFNLLAVLFLSLSLQSGSLEGVNVPSVAHIAPDPTFPQPASARYMNERPSARSVRDAVRDRQAKRNVTFREDSHGMSVEYPATWTVDTVLQTFEFLEGIPSSGQRVAIFSAPYAESTEQGTEVPYLPAFEHSTPLVSEYTDLNTISISVENLDHPMPSLDELTEDYIANLVFFGYDIQSCDCEYHLGGQSTRLVYSTGSDGSTTVQVWSIFDDESVILTMRADSEHYTEVYDVFTKMIATFQMK